MRTEITRSVPGVQFVRTAALGAVARHVVHLAVVAGGEPVEQMRFVLRRVRCALMPTCWKPSSMPQRFMSAASWE